MPCNCGCSCNSPLVDAASRLAFEAIALEQYEDDPKFRAAVDAVLNIVNPKRRATNANHLEVSHP